MKRNSHWVKKYEIILPILPNPMVQRADKGKPYLTHLAYFFVIPIDFLDHETQPTNRTCSVL